MTKNFTYEEVYYSRKALMLGIDNSLSVLMQLNAEYFAKNLLQPLRSDLGIPFIITSWYRSPALNKAVGGASNSSHLTAMAVDFNIQGISTRVAYKMVLISLETLRIPFDQLIIEKNTKTKAQWIHLSLKKSGNRYQSFSLSV